MKKTIGIAGWSGSGKTTLVENLIKVFKNKYKLKVCTIKHAHKSFEIDKKGKDSYRFSKAGSDQVIISSTRQWAVINQSNNEEKDLNFLLKNTISSGNILIDYACGKGGDLPKWIKMQLNLKTLQNYLSSIYKNHSHKEIKILSSEIKKIFSRSSNKQVSKELWDEKDCFLITYADSVVDEKQNNFKILKMY